MNAFNEMWVYFEALEGNNKYKIPHMGKNKPRKNDQLPKNIKASQEAINTALAKLQPPE